MFTGFIFATEVAIVSVEKMGTQFLAVFPMLGRQAIQATQDSNTFLWCRMSWRSTNELKAGFKPHPLSSIERRESCRGFCRLGGVGELFLVARGFH